MAAAAAETRAQGGVDRGVGDPVRASKRLEERRRQSAASTSDYFGSSAASRLRDDLKKRKDKSATLSSDISSGGGRQRNASDVSRADGLSLFSYRNSLAVRSVSDELASYLHGRFEPGTPWVATALEAGGGGDCLFHAIAAGLEHAIEYLGPDVLQYLLASEVFEVGDLASQRRMVARLRGAVADTFLKLDLATMNSEEDLLTFIAQRIHERQHGGRILARGVGPNSPCERYAL